MQPITYIAVIDDTDIFNKHIVEVSFDTWDRGYYTIFTLKRGKSKPITIPVYDSDYPKLRNDMAALFLGEVRGKLAEDFVWRLWYTIFVEDLTLTIKRSNGTKYPNPLPKFCTSYWNRVEKSLKI